MGRDVWCGSADVGFVRSNQDGDTTDLANTALKGIIGVKAMAEIAHALGQDSDAVQYGVSYGRLLVRIFNQAGTNWGL